MSDILLPDTWTLTKWLAVKTDAARQLVIECIDSHKPTLDESRCQRLLNAHVRFHRLVEPVYGDTNLKRMYLPIFFERKATAFQPRFRRDAENGLVANRQAPGGLLPPLGWLYATEFVDYGLIQLFADPQAKPLSLNFNAAKSRKLWQALREELDLMELSDSDEERLAAGACSSLNTYSVLFHKEFRAEP